MPGAWLRLSFGLVVLHLFLVAAGRATADHKEIEANLLKILGLSRRPQPSKDAYIPDAMRQLYEQHFQMNKNKGRVTRSADTIRSFFHTETRLDSTFKNQDKFRLLFNTSSIPATDVLKAAELHLHREYCDRPQLQTRVLVYDIIRPGRKNLREQPINRLIDTKLVSSCAKVPEGDNITFDVFPAFKRIQQANQSYGLLVVVDSLVSKVRLRRTADETPKDWQAKQPLLITYYDDQSNSEKQLDRTKRHVSRKPQRKPAFQDCRRHALYVNFEDVGWNDWIVAPQGYDAYFCHGDCPFPLPDHLNATNHAVVQTLVNSVHPSKIPKACCVPTQLASISMLYLDEENKVVLKNYQDMSVIGCGCR